MNNIFDGSSHDRRRSSIGPGRATASFSTTSSSTTPPTCHRRPTTATSAATSVRSSATRSSSDPSVRRRGRRELRARADLAGDRRRPAARSGRSPAANAIYPDRRPSRSTAGSSSRTRTDPATLPFPRDARPRQSRSAASARIDDPSQIVTLPGSGFFSFPDEWEPVLTTDPNGYSATDLHRRNVQLRADRGQRDILGYIRAPEIGSPASASAAIRSSTSVRSSTSTCTRPRSPA